MLLQYELHDDYGGAGGVELLHEFGHTWRNRRVEAGVGREIHDPLGERLVVFEHDQLRRIHRPIPVAR